MQCTMYELYEYEYMWQTSSTQHTSGIHVIVDADGGAGNGAHGEAAERSEREDGAAEVRQTRHVQRRHVERTRRVASFDQNSTVQCRSSTSIVRI